LSWISFMPSAGKARSLERARPAARLQHDCT
jgi:hypothetical protein